MYFFIFIKRQDGSAPNFFSGFIILKRIMTYHSKSEHLCHAQEVWYPIETVKQAAL